MTLIWCNLQKKKITFTMPENIGYISELAAQHCYQSHSHAEWYLCGKRSNFYRLTHSIKFKRVNTLLTSLTVSVRSDEWKTFHTTAVCISLQWSGGLHDSVFLNSAHQKANIKFLSNQTAHKLSPLKCAKVENTGIHYLLDSLNSSTKFQLNWITTQKFQLKLFNTAVT